MRKIMKWMLLVLVLCLSVALLAGCKETQQQQQEIKLYWNVDKFVYAPQASLPVCVG